MVGQDDLNQMYGDIILEHHRDPRNYGPLPHCDKTEEGFNPLCGDRVTLCCNFDEKNHKLKEIHFEGQGCSISMASSSILTEEMQGLTYEEIEKKIADFRALMQGEKSPEDFEGDVQALSGVRKFPVRIKCALLSWMTLKKVIDLKIEEGKGK